MDDLENEIKSSIKADFEQAPLPPEGAEGEPVAEVKKVEPELEVATLIFLDPGAMEKSIPLNWPFVWNGVEYHGVTARRLSYAEVARVYERAKDAEGDVKLIEFYAEMTGLPAAVLRGMESGDGQAVIEGCYPFLPRRMVAETSSSTSGNGGA